MESFEKRILAFVAAATKVVRTWAILVLTPWRSWRLSDAESAVFAPPYAFLLIASAALALVFQGIAPSSMKDLDPATVLDTVARELPADFSLEHAALDALPVFLIPLIVAPLVGLAFSATRVRYLRFDAARAVLYIVAAGYFHVAIALCAAFGWLFQTPLFHATSTDNVLGYVVLGILGWTPIATVIASLVWTWRATASESPRFRVGMGLVLGLAVLGAPVGAFLATRGRSDAAETLRKDAEGAKRFSVTVEGNGAGPTTTVTYPNKDDALLQFSCFLYNSTGQPLYMKRAIGSLYWTGDPPFNARDLVVANWSGTPSDVQVVAPGEARWLRLELATTAAEYDTASKRNLAERPIKGELRIVLFDPAGDLKDVTVDVDLGRLPEGTHDWKKERADVAPTFALEPHWKDSYERRPVLHVDALPSGDVAVTMEAMLSNRAQGPVFVRRDELLLTLAWRPLSFAGKFSPGEAMHIVDWPGDEPLPVLRPGDTRTLTLQAVVPRADFDALVDEIRTRPRPQRDPENHFQAEGVAKVFGFTDSWEIQVASSSIELDELPTLAANLPKAKGAASK
jgi:hypothetical protein